MKQPWELNPELTQERLKKLASLIRDVRDDVVDRHDDDLGDSARATGMRAYECCRTRIARASMDSEEWPWLGIVKKMVNLRFPSNQYQCDSIEVNQIVLKNVD